MTLPKHLAEKRDEMADKHVKCGKEILTEDKLLFSDLGYSYRKGFDACCTIMLEEFRPVVEALKNMSASHTFLCSTMVCDEHCPIILKREALAQFRERFLNETKGENK